VGTFCRDICVVVNRNELLSEHAMDCQLLQMGVQKKEQKSKRCRLKQVLNIVSMSADFGSQPVPQQIMLHNQRKKIV
jgi:hypothetical protein